MPWTTTDEFNVIPKTQRMSLASFPGHKSGHNSSTQTKPRRLFFGRAVDHLYPLSLKLNGSNRLGCWVLCFPPIYHSPPISGIFWLLPPRDSICWTNWKKCPSLFLISTVYLGHWLFHVFYMLYQLFMGSFYRATLITSTPCSEMPSDGVL